MAKKKLTEQQKMWLERLEWYSRNCISWDGNDKEFKDVVDVGRYAIFTYNGEGSDRYTSVIGAEDKHTYECMVNWNRNTMSLVVDLEMLMVVLEVNKPHKPTFGNLVAMMDGVKIGS